MKTKNTSPSVLKQGLAMFKGLLDKRTPWLAKLTGIIVLAYIILPFDFITDVIPVLGWLDDAAVTAIGMVIIAKLIPKEVMQDYLKDNSNKSI